MPDSKPTSPSAPPPVQTVDEAEQLMLHLIGIMDSLLRVLDEETELVREGRISEVQRLESTKSELARLYLADAASVRANCAYMARALPQQFDELRHRHDAFHALLKINLAVVATAHAVSEGIIRGVAEELARKATPQTYGISGRPSAPTSRTLQPITLSRTL